MRKALTFAFITILMLAVSSAADARGGKGGFGGGRAFHGARTYHGHHTTYGRNTAYHGHHTTYGRNTAYHGHHTTYGRNTAYHGHNTTYSRNTNYGGNTNYGHNTNGSGKTAGGTKTADSTNNSSPSPDCYAGKTPGHAMQDCGSPDGRGASWYAHQPKTNGRLDDPRLTTDQSNTDQTNNGTQTAYGTNNSSPSPDCYAGKTPGQAMQDCGSPDGRGASWYAHQPKTNGRLDDPRLTTNQSNTDQTNDDASQYAGTGQTSDGAYHDPKTGLTYYSTDGQPVQISNGD